MKDPFEGVETEQRRSIGVAVAVVIALIVWAVISPSAVAVVAVILALPLMIMLHELGHFVTAKRSGMKVTEFFVGFGPRIWSFTRGETEYGVKAVPLGGYCRIIGMTNLEEVPPEDEPRAYRSKRYGPKVLVASAGSLVHFLIALVLMVVLLGFAGDFHSSKPTTTLTAVDAGAKAAGLRPGDKVVAVDGQQITNWDQIHDAIIGSGDEKRTAGDTVDITVQRGNDTLTKSVKLSTDTSTGTSRVVAGISPEAAVPHPGLLGAIGLAPVRVAQMGGESLQALGHTFSPSGISDYFHTLASPAPSNNNNQPAQQGSQASSSSSSSSDNTRFISIFGFGRLAVDAVDAGWVAVVGLFVAINVFVGLFNLVPLLPFDGGHIAIATYEQIASVVQRRKVRVDAAKLLPITVAVVAVLGFIFLSSLFLDISHPLANPF